MSFTRRNKNQKRGTYRVPRETPVLVGPFGSIRCCEQLGLTYLSKMPDSVQIDGCDWRGAIAIYYFLKPQHKAITDGTDFYFMIPDISGDFIRDNVVFLVVFHHVYNIYLLKEPWTTPPFRSPLKMKYEYLQRVFANSDMGFLLEKDLVDIQTGLKQQVYTDWSDFIKIFANPWTTEVPVVERTDADRIACLQEICENADDVLRFLMYSIDDEGFVIPDLQKKDEEIDGLCNILLEKIDHHTIFLQTGIKPIAIDWIKELDLYLFL